MNPRDRPRTLIRLLIRLYPRSFRVRFGDEMLELALGRLSRAAGPIARLGTWTGVASDLTWGALMERLGQRPSVLGAHATTTIRAWDAPYQLRSRGWGDKETMMETLRHDLGSTVRRVFRTPWFSLAAIVIVALGIGANTAVFTFVNAVLLRAPPFAEAERVVRIYQDSDDGEPNSSSFPAYRDMTEFTEIFSSVSASSPDEVQWEREDGPASAVVAYTTASHIDVIGYPPQLGRWFEPAFDVPGAGYYAVVSHHTWTNQMGGDPGVLGRVVRMNGRPVTIIGVGPEGHVGIDGPVVTDFWLSISSTEVGGAFRVSNLDRREDHWYNIQARLAPGVEVAQARSAMESLANRLAEEYPELNEGRDISVFAAADVALHPQVDGSIAPVAGLLLGIAGIVLLLACSNLANLLLVQGISRSSEVAVRRAIGASRGRVANLFLGEALLLAAVGGVVGVLIARWGLELVNRTPGLLPVDGQLDLSMDGRVLAFTVALVAASACFFGLAPALRSARSDPGQELRSEGRSASQSRGTSLVQGGLVATQVAASVVLLVGAGLLVRSLANLERVDPGFDPSAIAYLQTNTNFPGLEGDESASLLLERAREAIEALPGVERAALTTRVPVGFGGSTTTVVEGFDPTSGTGSVELDFAAVDDAYFDVLGLRVVAGRSFGPDDGPGGPYVVIVNEAAARRFWGGDALGGRIRPQSIPGAWRDVVGVVADHAIEDVGDTSTPMLFYPLGRGGVASGFIVARTNGSAADALGPMRLALAAVNPALPLSALDTMEGRMGEALRMPRITAGLLGVFALLALLLASVGVYSVVSFSVARRTAELGIRVALGADSRRLVVGAVLKMLAVVGVGVGVGLGVAALVVPLLGGVLFGVPSLDPWTFSGAALVLTVLAGGAAWIPARRAARADPVEALRAR